MYSDHIPTIYWPYSDHFLTLFREPLKAASLVSGQPESSNFIVAKLYDLQEDKLPRDKVYKRRSVCRSQCGKVSSKFVFLLFWGHWVIILCPWRREKNINSSLKSNSARSPSWRTWQIVLFVRSTSGHGGRYRVINERYKIVLF